MTTLTQEEATIIVGAWHAHAPVWRLGDELKQKFREQAWNMGVRVLLAGGNKIASDALWDGKSDAAVIKYLVKHGMPDKRWLNMKREIGARTLSLRGGEVNRIIPVRHSGTPYSPESDWKYCK